MKVIFSRRERALVRCETFKTHYLALFHNFVGNYVPAREINGPKEVPISLEDFCFRLEEQFLGTLVKLTKYG